MNKTAENKTKLQHPRTYRCKRLALFRYLTEECGHVPYRTIDELDENGKPNGYNNWLFVNSPRFEENLSRWIETHVKNKK